MTVGVVLADLPLPITSGSHLRDWQQLQLLKALGHRVRLLAFVPPGRGASDAALRPLRDITDDVTTIPCGADRREAHGAGTVRRRLASVWPWHPRQLARHGYLKDCYPMAWAHDAVDGGPQVASWARRRPTDVVLLRSLLLHYLPLLKRAGVRVIVDAHAVHSWDLWESARSDRRWLRKGLLAMYALTVYGHERHYLKDCDEVWATSPPEAALFRRLSGGRPRVLALPNLVDPPRYRPDPLGASLTILLVGAFGFPANAEAAERLVATIFPSVKRRVPAAQVCLVGSGLPARVAEQARRIGSVQITGEVPDVRPYLESATVVAIPLRGVGGIPYKLIEAMASAKAIVATSRAIAGTEARPGEHCLVADTARAFVEALVELLADPAKRRRLGLAARALVERDYSYAAGVRILQRHSLLGRPEVIARCAS